MENEEYSHFIEEYTIKLNDLRDKFSLSTELIFKNSEFNEAIYYISLVNKAIELLDGFFVLIKSRNLTCLSLVLRTQLDNCMRTYAGYIVEDKCKYFEEFPKLNSRLNNMKDINGKKLTDANLRKYLNQFDKSFGDAYTKASKFVHHTDSSLTTFMRMNEDNEILLDIGNTNNEHTIEIIYSLAKAFIYFLDMQYMLIEVIYKLKQTESNTVISSKMYS